VSVSLALAFSSSAFACANISSKVIFVIPFAVSGENCRNIPVATRHKPCAVLFCAFLSIIGVFLENVKENANKT